MSCGIEIPTSIYSLYNTMHFCAALCDLFGILYSVFCGTWHELLSSHAYRRHPQVVHGCCPGAGVWHGHRHGVRSHGHVMVPVWGETHKRNEKERLKIPFWGRYLSAAKRSRVRGQPELHFMGVRSLSSLYGKKALPYWHECFVIFTLISTLRSVTGERGGEATVTLLSVWLCIDIYNTAI